MKKYLVFAAVLTVLVLVSGCDLLGLGEETWSYSISGMCIEISTTDADLKDALDAAGYDKESCDVDDSIGSCEVAEYTGFSAYGDAEWVVYFDDTYTADVAELSCDYLDGVWND